MPSLRYLLLMVSIVLFGCYFPTAIDLIARRLDDAGAFSESWSRGIASAEKRQTRLEKMRAERDQEDERLLQFAHKYQRVMKNPFTFGLPVKQACLNATTPCLLEGERKRQLENAWDSIDDSEHIRKVEEICNVCDRILNMCDECPAIVQFHQNHPRRHSDQDIPADVSQMSIQDILTLLILIVLAIASVLVAIAYRFFGFDEFLAEIRNDPKLVKIMAELPRFIGPIRAEFLARLPLRLVVSWSSEKIIESFIYLGLLLVFGTGVLPDALSSFVFAWRRIIIYVLYLAVSPSFNRFLHRRFDSSNETLWALDRELQLLKRNQRIVENRLLAGATRDDLRAFEQNAMTTLDGMSSQKSKYESNPLYMFMNGYSHFIVKLDEIIAVGERILYLCRPAVAA